MNANKLKTSIYSLVLVALITIMGCEDVDNFLKEEPNTFYTVDNAFSSPAQVDAAVIACYEHVRNMYLNEGGISRILQGLGTDVMNVPELRLGDTFADYNRLDPDGDEYNDVYTGFYELISKANTVLFSADLDNMQWPSEEEKNYTIAQAKFFRALAYRNLGNLFGGVPIVDELVSNVKLDFERATIIETYQFAIDDLESSLDDLPEVTSEDGRIVRGAAQHYLSELYLAMGIELEEQGESGDAMYDQALSYANQLIDGGIYSLMTERFGTRIDEENSLTGGADVYWDLFQEGNVNYTDGNNETIWAYQIDFEAYLAEDENSRIQYPRFYVPVLRFIDGIEGVEEDVGGRGVSFAAPTMHVRDGVWEDVLEDDNRNAEHNLRRIFRYNNSDHPQFGEVVPYSVLYEDDFLRSIVYPIHMKITTDQFTGVDQGENKSHLFRDEYAIRLAETILLRAEIYFRKGQLQNAADDINRIRDRAQADYRATASDIDLDFILDERIRELYIEEHRWNTLLRMRGTVAVDRIREHAFHDFTRSSLSFDFNKWPIPQTQIDRNTGAPLEQNPGWTQF